MSISEPAAEPFHFVEHMGDFGARAVHFILDIFFMFIYIDRYSIFLLYLASLA